MRLRTNPLFFKLLLVLNLSLLCASQDFDFFYFVQQWPGSYRDTKQSCCYPSTGNPSSDFGIHGLWPNYKDGSYPSNCDPSNPFDQTQVSDLIGTMQKQWPTLSCPSNDGVTFWTHEWNNHGTCSESNLDQHTYFSAALSLKQQVDLLQILNNAGIQANGELYSLSNIKNAIKKATRYTPFVECNIDISGSSQLYQVYSCVDTSGSNFMECPCSQVGSVLQRLSFLPFKIRI